MKKKSSRRSRASPSRGWGKVAPKTKSSRQSMKSKCGSRCFLQPKDLKFPVCNPKTCKVSCKGAVTAKVRAAQWKYPEVYKKASRLVERKKCTKASRAKKVSRKSRRKVVKTEK